MIDRRTDFDRLKRGLARSRVVALLGPRQSGKTTLARRIVPPESRNYFDLEDPRHLAVLGEPMSALEQLKGVVVIDEVQHRPELFQVLRVLADRNPLPARFLVLGSASSNLLRQSSESLAGRIESVVLEGLNITDLGPKALAKHWLRGSYPNAFTLRDDAKSVRWRREFVQTFFERDLAQYGISIPPVALRRFWHMLAHYHGQTWNAAELARAMGANESTARRYVDILSSLFMVRQLPPWFENLGKRQVKSPKIYIRDSGLLHTLLDIENRRDLELNPRVGASWEGYVVEEIIKAVEPYEAYFWGTHQGAELDLLLFSKSRRIGIECKRTDAPTLTPSMKIAHQDLKLDELHIIYPGEAVYALADNVSASPLMPFLEYVEEKKMFSS